MVTEFTGVKYTLNDKNERVMSDEYRDYLCSLDMKRAGDQKLNAEGYKILKARIKEVLNQTRGHVIFCHVLDIHADLIRCTLDILYHSDYPDINKRHILWKLEKEDAVLHQYINEGLQDPSIAYDIYDVLFVNFNYCGFKNYLFPHVPYNLMRSRDFLGKITIGFFNGTPAVASSKKWFYCDSKADYENGIGTPITSILTFVDLNGLGLENYLINKEDIKTKSISYLDANKSGVSAKNYSGSKVTHYDENGEVIDVTKDSDDPYVGNVKSMKVDVK